MSVAPDQTPAASPGDFGEKVSISQLILNRLDDIRHDQDILRQDFNGLRQELSALRQDVKQDLNTLRQETKQDLNVIHQEISALRYWSWGSIVAILVATVTIILSLKP